MKIGKIIVNGEPDYSLSLEINGIKAHLPTKWSLLMAGVAVPIWRALEPRPRLTATIITATGPWELRGGTDNPLIHAAACVDYIYRNTDSVNFPWNDFEEEGFLEYHAAETRDYFYNKFGKGYKNREEFLRNYK